MRREYLDPTNGRYGPPKSGKRLVDLDDTLVAKLESYIQGLRKQSLANGGQVEYLFPGISQRMAQRAWSGPVLPRG
jgi:hypothetical protein